jgi:hypothetical protein
MYENTFQLSDLEYGTHLEFLLKLENTKGQLISEWKFGVPKSPKNPTKF